MADITMCEGEAPGIVCPKREECYRYKATPSEHRQSYFAHLPVINANGKCKHFDPLYPEPREE